MKQTINCPPDIELLLGQMHDKVVAEKAGVSISKVVSWRKERDIPALGRDKNDCPPEVAPLLGTMKDQDLADHVGADKYTVFRWRREAGIPSFDPRGRKSAHLKNLRQPGGRALVEKALREAQPAANGMVISFENYSRLCALVFPQ